MKMKTVTQPVVPEKAWALTLRQAFALVFSWCTSSSKPTSHRYIDAKSRCFHVGMPDSVLSTFTLHNIPPIGFAVNFYFRVPSVSTQVGDTFGSVGIPVSFLSAGEFLIFFFFFFLCTRHCLLYREVHVHPLYSVGLDDGPWVDFQCISVDRKLGH